VERSLLAATQQRQGPNHQNLFGFLVFVFDGLKLFSKALLGNTFFGVLIVVGTLLVVPIFVDIVIGKSQIPNLGSIQLFATCVIAFLETLTFLNFVSSQNSYVTVAISRFVEVTIALELVWGFTEVIGFASHTLIKTSGGFQQIFFILSILLFWLAVLGSGKAPFDVIEAESELIDG
jgi:NADH:ubiquinone oxidoreductase subunit H